MTTWTDGGMYGQVRREIVSEDGRHPIATVRVKQYLAGNGTEPWPEGEANFRLVLAAPQMLEALEEIAEGAIVSSEQAPEKIAEQVLRVLRLARESAAEYMIYAGKQQQRAERAEAVLEAIRDKADCMLKLAEKPVDMLHWGAVKAKAVIAIAAVKGEGDSLAAVAEPDEFG